MGKLIEPSGIAGLNWEDRWRLPNGREGSFVVPFATIRPVNLVFHGEDRFDYGHFGIHLGQDDRLTFLGRPEKEITGYFIDCREGSVTLHKRLSMKFSPTSGRTLIIPRGVAHTFFGLDQVHTINEYRLALPDPSAWAEGQTQWRAESDIINIPLGIKDEDLPILRPNEHVAADAFYFALSELQAEHLPVLSTEFPMTRDFQTEGGARRVILKKLRDKPAGEVAPNADWTPVSGIGGVGWQKHLRVHTGKSSGIVPLFGPSPFYAVDHGFEWYSHDSYGIHLGQEDRLTFLGPSAQKATVRLLDCRQGSPTLHHKAIVEFTPSALRYLVLPPGVAHAFENLENIFTLNRPRIFLSSTSEYVPGRDVIDWPLSGKPNPTFTPNTEPAGLEFYERQAAGQCALLRMRPEVETPKVGMWTDPETGDRKRLVLRKISS